MKNSSADLGPVVYSCYDYQNKDGEQFIPEHLFSFQIAGTLIVNDGKQVTTYREGDFIFCRRNSLVKAVKVPPEKGDYKAVTVFIDQETLFDFCQEFNYHAEKISNPIAIIKLDSHVLYRSYMESMLPYQHLSLKGNEALFAVKIREAIILLLKYNPELKNYLFDLSEPGKLDLEEFMTKNYRFNVSLSRFAYLTGRSLATFKRDFEKVFNTTPGRWLQKTRLEEAYYQIKQKNKKPSDVYIEVGFETIAHFSYSFKQYFGVNPSGIRV